MNCPNCESKKIKPHVRLWLIWIVAASIIALVPVLGWIAAPLMLLTTPIVYLAERKKRAVQCNECKHRFLVSKQEFREWQSDINYF